MNVESSSAKTALAMGRIALFIANMISVGGGTSAKTEPPICSRLKAFADRRLLVRLFCWMQIDSRQRPVGDIYLHGSILTETPGLKPPMLK